jgi:CubicO group peptidase (beta-lactamase class C family)
LPVLALLLFLSATAPPTRAEDDPKPAGPKPGTGQPAGARQAAGASQPAGAGQPDAAAAKARYDAAADYSAGLGGRALLVMLDGQVVYERYDRGWAADKPHPLASGTKSFAGVLAAAAVEDKVIDGWDARVADAVPAWRRTSRSGGSRSGTCSRWRPGWRRRTRRSSPAAAGRLLGDAAARRTDRIGKAGVPEADDKHAAALAAKMTGRPGEQFEYGATHFYAFAAYLEARLAATGNPHKTVEAYFRARVADPIGLKVGYWGRDKQGHVNLPGGMALTAREWAKFGEFVRLGGAVRRSDGTLTQIIDPVLLAECFKPSSANPQYGLTWWLPGGDGDAAAADADRVNVSPTDPAKRRRQAEQMTAITTPDGMPAKVYMAAGLGKQRLIVMPDQKLVVVRYAEATRDGQRYSDAKLIGTVMGWQP